MGNDNLESTEDVLHHPDPIKTSFASVPFVGLRWLKGGEELTMVQRIGYLLLSLSVVGMGRFLVELGIVELRGDTLMMGLLTTLAAVPFFVFGALGIRNVMRFM